MKIRNINVSEDLIRKISDLDIQFFVLNLIRPLEEECYSSIKYFPESCLERIDNHIRTILYGYENIATLVHTIPIYLIEKGALPEQGRELEGESPEENLELEGEKCIDFLGAYFQNIRQNNESNPYIELYVDRIYDLANKNNKKFTWLFAITLIHELAHAVLDNYNLCILNRHVTKLRYNSEFVKWREESMANAIALRIIKDSWDIRFYDYARNFMLSQPREYALGVLMEDFDYWDMRSVMDNKYEGVDQTLQDQWLYYVKGDPDWEGLRKWNERLVGY